MDPHMMHNPQQPHGMPVSAQYEFNARENAILGSAANWMLIVAAINLGARVFVGARPNAMGMFFLLVESALLWMGASALKRAVTTQGNDVMHLMEAVDRLNTVLTLRVVVRLAGFVFAAIAAVVLLLGVIALASMSAATQ